MSLLSHYETKQIQVPFKIKICNRMMSYETTFRKLNEILILLQSEVRQIFHISKAKLDIFIVMFSFVLVTLQVFEYSGPWSLLHLPV
jgi:hypothetical protein